MTITIDIEPMPAKRMTRNSKWSGDAKRYIDFKNELADEIRLHFLGRVKGSKVKIDKMLPKNMLPLKQCVIVQLGFYRSNQRRCDIDNLVKMALDLLQTAGILYNDDQVRELHAKLSKGYSKPYFTITILPQSYAQSK
jgi:Holliday junction resolvase RusA-like endonuclease